MQDHPDAYYVARVVEGEKNAFAPLVDAYKNMVFTLCLRMLGDEVDAEEAAQEVFIKVFNSISSYREKSAFSTWVYRITYNHCISVIRKKIRVIDLADEVPDDRVDEGVMDGLDRLRDEDRAHYVQKALEAIPETDAFMVTLFYFEALDLEEIARITGYSSGNVRTRLHRARKKIYEVLQGLLHKEIRNIL